MKKVRYFIIIIIFDMISFVREYVQFIQPNKNSLRSRHYFENTRASY